ncbi:MAG: DUF2188 domain-containing protein [Calditrichia bacterium]
MAARNVFRIVPQDGMWDVIKDWQVISRHLSEQEAMEAANLLAKKIISSRVLVYRPDGSIRQNAADSLPGLG